MMTFLRVTSVENFNDRNGRPYQKVKFSEVGYLPNGQEYLTGKIRYRNLWSTTPEITGDTLFGQLQTGSMVEGSIQSFNTTPFSLENRTVNKTTVVVFGFEDGIKIANRQLKQNTACALDEHGQPTVSLNDLLKVQIENLKEIQVEDDF